MADLVLRPARDGDSAALWADMRPLDRAEVEAMAGADAWFAVSSAIRQSPDALTAVLGGEVAAVFGTVPLSLVGDAGQIWMLGTTLMHRIGRSLGLIARRYVAEASRTYPLLVNYVDARNAPSLRLIRWLGFEVQAARPFGVAGLPFHRFELRSTFDQCVLATEQHPSPTQA